ncbi:hypothetical protein ACT8ZV_15290 [Nocardioides sp. MAHUQ-72]|uniref:hypothetical protein n=1 Tax=unclassified Nocardioides TaxID=2615069 RepID=UPI00361A1991
MPGEDELRTALATAVDPIHPDVEAELERVLARATTRTRARRAAYAAALVAAVALAVLLAGHDWGPRAAGPEPAEPVTVQALTPQRGMFRNPADLVPGTYQVTFLPGDWWHGIVAEVTVPAGWGQDDRYALATGPAERPATRRLDFFTGPDAVLARCSRTGLGASPTPLEVARAVGSVAGMSASAPQPVTLDGHNGYLVELRDTPAKETSTCDREDNFLYAVPGMRGEASGFTALMWTFEVEGRQATVFASYGPDVTDDQVDELVRMVESARFTPA